MARNHLMSIKNLCKKFNWPLSLTDPLPMTSLLSRYEWIPVCLLEMDRSRVGKQMRTEWSYIPAPTVGPCWRMGEKLLLNQVWYCGRLYYFPKFFSSLPLPYIPPQIRKSVIPHLIDVGCGHVSVTASRLLVNIIWVEALHNVLAGCVLISYTPAIYHEKKMFSVAASLKNDGQVRLNWSRASNLNQLNPGEFTRTLATPWIQEQEINTCSASHWHFGVIFNAAKKLELQAFWLG